MKCRFYKSAHEVKGWLIDKTKARLWWMSGFGCLFLISAISTDWADSLIIPITLI
ncbi:hypothetical protein [Trabulsiella odontotermitis]|uniref:hypothetical protein n=1 Tax=Trabulsiella odontotermitis TaxID=379893 RepID=UPI000AA58994|nr:hypothetical protein [Trabulsiella odontotermitis]